MVASNRSSGRSAKMQMGSFTCWRTASTQRLARAAKCPSSCRSDLHNEANSSRIVPMRIFLATIATAALLGLLIGYAGAADDLRPDADGYIRDWIMLAPIALPEGDTCAEALLKEQVPNESALRPKAGDKVKIGGKELTWRNVTASTNYFDFNES